ncbi:hypothetical protein [Aquibacillus kalidii]|uniref:hypothetical protein n=1 Tax=Aquibacillus kalidii TaxID=2762597 RepID=UPI0016478CCD|nr:hypothetical protein [Aquibacillus kalidii]
MKYTIAIPLLFITLLLSGCFYPNSQLSKNQVPNDVQLEMVQNAVDQYVERQQGLVPIKTKTNDTPIFEKYLLDFSLLKQEGIMQSVPGTAFENGGLYQYVLITPEDNPRVKLIDLRISAQLRTVKQRLNVYRSEHIYPPFGEEVAEGVFSIDTELLNLDEVPYIVSPFTQKNLPIVMDIDGNLYVDYSQDLYEALQKFEHDYKQGDDIRYILAENYPFVPAYSLPYTIKNNEPTFLKQEEK